MTPEEKRKRLNELFAKMVNFDSPLSAEEELEFQSLNNDPEVSEAKEKASEPIEMLRKETSPEKVKEDLNKRREEGPPPNFDNPETPSEKEESPEPRGEEPAPEAYSTPITPYDPNRAPGYSYGQGGQRVYSPALDIPEVRELTPEEAKDPNLVALQANEMAARDAAIKANDATRLASETSRRESLSPKAGFGAFDAGDGLIQTTPTVGAGGNMFPQERKRTSQERRSFNAQVAVEKERAKQAQKMANQEKAMRNAPDFDAFKQWANAGISRRGVDGRFGEYIDGGIDRMLAEDIGTAVKLFDTYRDQRIRGAVNKEEERIRKEGLGGYTKAELDEEMKNAGWTFRADEDGLRRISPDQNETFARAGNYPSFKDFRTAEASGSWGPWEASNALKGSDAFVKDKKPGGEVYNRPVYRRDPNVLAPGEVDPFPDPYNTPAINQGINQGTFQKMPSGDVNYTPQGARNAITNNLVGQLNTAAKIEDQLRPIQFGQDSDIPPPPLSMYGGDLNPSNTKKDTNSTVPSFDFDDEEDLRKRYF